MCWIDRERKEKKRKEKRREEKRKGIGEGQIKIKFSCFR